MEWLINLLYYLVPFIVLLGILVFVHEFGHFLIARLCGVRVSAFSIGFGKELWGHLDKYGTRWKISLIPLGGYCQFLGDADEASAGTDQAIAELSEEDKKHAFAFQNPYKKLAIVLGGPGFNYLFAFLVYVGLFMAYGKFTFPPIVGDLLEDGAAAEAGIEVGDRILKIGDVEVEDFSQIIREVSIATDPKTTVEVRRGDEIKVFDVTLKSYENSDKDSSQRRYMLGVVSVSTPESGLEPVSFPTALVLSWNEISNVTVTTLRGVGQMITGKRSGEDIGGVIRIAEMTGDISKNQKFADFLVFMALISINLGLINLFPIPVLDGGHVVFFLMEIVSRRELSEKIKTGLFKFGFALLMALMLFATWNDIVHLINRFFAE